MIRRSINRLINPESLPKLIFTYALFILGLLLLFSTMFNFVEVLGMGYLKYGSCNANFDSSMIKNDPQISRDFFYFSATTFFTVGYGDICPMGFERVISIITAFIGHLISVVMVGLIINNYLKKKEMN